MDAHGKFYTKDAAPASAQRLGTRELLSAVSGVPGARWGVLCKRRGARAAENGDDVSQGALSRKLLPQASTDVIFICEPDICTNDVHE